MLFIFYRKPPICGISSSQGMDQNATDTVFDGCGYAYPKYQNSQVCNTYKNFKKKMRDKFDIFTRLFLQAAAIIYGGHSQAFPKYPKSEFSKIFAISQERRKV